MHLIRYAYTSYAANATQAGEVDHIIAFVVGGGNYVEMADVKATLQQVQAVVKRVNEAVVKGISCSKELLRRNG